MPTSASADKDRLLPRNVLQHLTGQVNDIFAGRRQATPEEQRFFSGFYSKVRWTVGFYGFGGMALGAVAAKTIERSGRGRPLHLGIKMGLSSLAMMAGAWYGLENTVPMLIDGVLALPPSSSPLSAECRRLLREDNPNNEWLKRAERSDASSSLVSSSPSNLASPWPNRAQRAEPDWKRADRELLEQVAPLVQTPVAENTVIVDTMPLLSNAAAPPLNATPSKSSWDAVRERYKRGEFASKKES